MGDDQGDDFEISETALITEGGGGAYGDEEEAASASEDDDDNTKINAEQVGSWTGMQDKGEKSSEKKVKRKDKLLEMKSAKKRRMEEEGGHENDSQFDVKLGIDGQLELFNKFQPRDKLNGTRAMNLREDSFLDPLSYNGKDAAKWKESIFTCAVASVLPSLESLHIKSDEMGCPQVLVVSAAALRASHILNTMSSQLKCPFAKLWSKHFKVPQQVDALGKKAYPIGVGTPARINKLFEVGALDARNLKLVILDVARNQKNFHLCSLSDTQVDTYTLIERYVLRRLTSGQCKLCMVAYNEKF